MRIKVLLGIIVSCFIFLFAGLFYVQIIKGADYKYKSENNRMILLPIEAPRGKIFDRNGRIIVDNRISFDVSVVYKNAKDSAAMINFLSDKLEVSKQFLREKMDEAKWQPYVPTLLLDDIGKDKAVFLEENSLDYPGLVISTRPRRFYPYHKYGASVIGYLGKINKDELSRYKHYGYTIRDYIGRSGIEREYDDYLRGHQGGMQVETDSVGRRKKTVSIKQAIKGKDIYLTIDIELEKYCDRLLGQRNGCIIVMAPDTGQIYALVSKPSYDPNIFVTNQEKAEVVNVLTNANGDYPLLNRAISCAYPPGSVFKIVVSLAALETMKITDKTYFNCSGSFSLGKASFKCWKKTGHGSQNIVEALTHSCNVFFYQAGVKIGVESIVHFAEELGFGKKTGIDIPGEIKGNLPSPSWKRKNIKEPWYLGDTVNLSIGQGFLLVTPIQLLRMVACVGNNGKMVTPYLVEKIEEVPVFNIEQQQLKVDEKNIKVIKDGLKRVVNDQNGTGMMAKVEQVVVSGKTGTAQNQTNVDHGWFSGFAPEKYPKVAVIVFVEYGGKGGYEASKIAQLVFEECIKVGLLKGTGNVESQ
ncbi:MAG: penicillin-binding protein 2 [Candidatus Omnitrophica bacterium]|nr:penicillin-binding protein 2 [Candidatus Omnitrophota bacterium]